MKALAIKVYGKVQGVWFRASTKRKADLLGISGTVSNQPDGSVLIHAVGDDASIAELLTWCHQGPIHANVERVESLPLKDDLDHDHDHDTFSILR